MTTIASITALPSCPYNGSGLVGIAITNGVPCYFKVDGSDLGKIISVNWYPKNINTVEFTIRNMILIDDTIGTFMVMVTDNYLSDNNRGGYLSFRLEDETTITAPVKTYGRISIGQLWTSPSSGLIT